MPVAHQRIRFEGTLPGGEVWSTGCSYRVVGSAAPMTYETLDAWARAVALLEAGVVLPSAVRQIMSSAVALTTIRAEQVGPDGRLAEVAEHVLPNPVAGGGTLTKPHQSSIVASLVTGRPGRSYRGRMYLPALSVALETTTGRMTTALAQSLADAIGPWLTAVGDAVDDAFAVSPVVASQTLGVVTPLTQVRVGDVLDTQRRRRDSLPEGYSAYSFPVTGGSF